MSMVSLCAVLDLTLPHHFSHVVVGHYFSFESSMSYCDAKIVDYFEGQVNSFCIDFIKRVILSREKKNMCFVTRICRRS